MLSDSGPLQLPNFLIKASVGANEDWQNLIVRIVPDVLDRTMFVGSQAPTVDPTGTLLFETAAGAHGTLVLTVLCIDDGGSQGNGSDTSEPMLTTLRVLPRPMIDCVSPAILAASAQTTATLTISGQHFGGHASRG